MRSRHRAVRLLSVLLAAFPHFVYGSEPDALPAFDCVIEPSEIVELGSATAGVLEKVHLHRADRVRKGEEVARLESKVEEAALRVARLRARQEVPVKLRQRAAALSDRTRLRHAPLVNRSAVSMQEMDEIEVEAEIATLQVQEEEENLRIAREELRRARAVMERRIIRSPVDGVVMDRFKTAGEFVEDEPILQIAQLDPLHVEVILPVEFLGRIHPFMKAEVVASIPDAQAHIAEVRRVDVVADAASGTYGVQLELPNPEQTIPAGLRCEVSFLAGPPVPGMPALDQPAVGLEPVPEPGQDPEAEPAPSPDGTTLDSAADAIPEKTPVAMQPVARDVGVPLAPEAGTVAEPETGPLPGPELFPQEAGPLLPAGEPEGNAPDAAQRELEAGLYARVRLYASDVIGAAVEGVGRFFASPGPLIAKAEATPSVAPLKAPVSKPGPVQPEPDSEVFELCCLSLVPAETRALSHHPERLFSGAPGVEIAPPGYRVLGP